MFYSKEIFNLHFESKKIEQYPFFQSFKNNPEINYIVGHSAGGSAALELQKKNKKYALCTLCIGVGQGYAMIIENVNL